MRARIGLRTVIGLAAALGATAARAQYQQGVPPRQPAAQPQRVATQPQYSGPQPQHPAASPEALTPRDPRLIRRVPGSPFALTPHEQADLDRLLERWEQHGNGVKTFECKFTRFEYDGVFDSGDKPTFIDEGQIRYAAPDKGLFRVDGELVDYRWANGKAVGGRLVQGGRLEHWICDGQSIFEYNFRTKQLVEHKLPPELQGKAISDSPLPFIFGAKADDLKNRYFLRIVTPRGADGQVWLEARPRFQADAANFQRATLILTLDSMQPFAVESLLPNGKSRTVYQFHDPRVNARNPLDPLRVFENNWLHPRTPPGWTRVVEEVPQVQAGRTPEGNAVR